MLGSRRFGVHFLVGLFLAGRVVGMPFADWSHRLEIRVAADVPGALTNFPVLVILDPDAIDGFDYTDVASPADGADLRFADAAQTNILNYEIELWNTNGASVIWVQVPVIEDTNTLIHAYWGRPDVDAPDSTTNGVVWSEGYAAVWHLGQSGARIDATMNGFDGTAESGVTPTADGLIGPADVFSGGAINCGNLSITGDQTIEMWIYPTGFASRRNPINKAYGGEGTITIETSAEMNYYWGTAGGDNTPYQAVNSGVSLPVNTWSHIVVVRDLSSPSRTVRWYINGRRTASVAASYEAATASSADLLLGRGYTNPFQGEMDEVRLSSVARGSNWVWASWLNQASNDVFLAYSDAAPQATNLAVAARSASAIGDTSATFNGAVLHAGGAENPAVYFCWGTADAGVNVTSDWEHVIAMGADWGAGDLFSTQVTGLLSGSNYTYRCYVTNSTGEAWSEAVSLTTRTLPAIDNHGPDWTRRRQTQLAGELADDGGEPALVWVEYWLDGSASTSMLTIGILNAQPFVIEIDNLDAAAAYQYRFGASNAAGAVWSSIDGFSTLTDSPIGWYVATNGLATTGIDWISAFSDLPAALAVAEAGDTLYLKGETFPLDAAISWTTSGITIQGGYAGNTVGGLPGEHDPQQWPTALERTGSADHRIMTISGVSAGVLRYVTIRNGYLNGTVNGGGVLISGCSNLLIEGCNIVSNRLYHWTNQYPKGAGIHAVNSSVTITNCWFHGNDISGGNWNWSGNAFGGALYVQGGTVNVFDSTIVSNTAFSNGNGGGYGGGVYFTGGGPHRIVNSRIQHNVSNGRHGYGGGLYMTGVGVALIENTLMTDNWALREGGGVWMNGGTIRNSLIANNVSPDRAGGVHMQQASSQLQNVTIVGNTSSALGSIAGLNLIAGGVTNTIVYHNTRTVDSAHVNITASGGTVGYSCTWPLRTGPGNTGAEPEWMDRAVRNYRLRPGSPAIDTGFDLPWMAGAMDVESEYDRIVGAAVDMGAYETDFSSQPLICNLIADQTTALDELEVTFTAYADGAMTGGLHYFWDFENTGVFDLEGPDQQVVSRVYGIGRYAVRLVVSNAIGETAEMFKDDYIRVASSRIYVSTDGNHSSGLNWTDAYTNLQTALDLAGVSNTILIAGGTYNMTEYLSWSGHSDVTIRGGYEGEGIPGEHDPDRWPTILRQTSGSTRVMLMNELDNCRMEQVTITGGLISSDGGGIRVLNSPAVTIVDCVISNNIATGGANTYRKGGGVYVQNSNVNIQRTRIERNTSRVTSANWSGWSRGGGLYVETGELRVENSSIVSNLSSGANNQGSFGAGASHAAGSRLTLRNCLVAFNQNLPAGTRSHGGAGVELFNGGLVENCTIADNWMDNPNDVGAGLLVSGGAVTNTVVFGNLRAGSPQDFGGNASLVWSSCAPELTDGVNDNLTADPLYVDAAAGNYRLRLESPCVDTGADADWMWDARDLDGNPRVQWGRPDRARRVDRGAYEAVPLIGSVLLIR